MRDYGKVSPRFWIGETGRKLRKMPDAQRIAMYLMTAPMAEMTGVFYCPIATILNDVGAPCEGLDSPAWVARVAGRKMRSAALSFPIATASAVVRVGGA